MENIYKKDIEQILSHLYDNGDDLWTTSDHKLLKGAPFTTLESVMYLIELGVSLDEPVIQETAKLIWMSWKEDGRFKISPTGRIYPCHSALACQALCYMGFVNDQRIQKTIQYFLQTQQEDGGWKCHKYSFGRGPETNYSTPLTTLVVLDIMRFTHFLNQTPALDKAVDFL